MKFCIFPARRLFEILDEQKKVTFRRDPFQERVKMVRHHAEGMHAKSPPFRSDFQTRNKI